LGGARWWGAPPSLAVLGRVGEVCGCAYGPAERAMLVRSVQSRKSTKAGTPNEQPSPTCASSRSYPTPARPQPATGYQHHGSAPEAPSSSPCGPSTNPAPRADSPTGHSPAASTTKRQTRHRPGAGFPSQGPLLPARVRASGRWPHQGSCRRTVRTHEGRSAITRKSWSPRRSSSHDWEMIHRSSRTSRSDVFFKETLRTSGITWPGGGSGTKGLNPSPRAAVGGDTSI
jgi:hypothetical protein